jgi:DmsE family decaheme c-type cytochrome
MHLKSILAAAGLLAACAVLMPSPALAQTAIAKPVCANCHEQQSNSIMLTAHGANNDEKGTACESCHGNASQHVQDPMKNKMVSVLTTRDATAAEKTGVCLTCHGGTRQFAFWSAGAHKKNDVACSDCHSIHGGQAAGNFRNIKDSSFAAAPYTTTSKQLAYKTCIGCHRDVRGEIVKPSHHPIVEGKVACHDCHDPHGTPTPLMLKSESVHDLCVTCHADKRGPWIHEHPPVMENCATCHTPHGSAHKGLLAQKPPVLCGDCHPGGHTHGIYDGRGTLPNTNPSNVRFVSSGCVDCHRQIHGSNAPPAAYGEFFLR